VAKPTFAKDKEKARAQQAAMDLLAEPQTLAARTVTAIRPHAVKLAALLAGVLVVIIGLAIWTSWTTRKAARATDAFGKLVAVSGARVDEAGPQIELSDPSNPVPTTQKADYKTFAERSQKALELIPTLPLEGKVADRAKLVQAGLLYDVGKYDEAIVAYKAFIAADAPADLTARAREGIGYALEAKALAQTDAAARNAGLDEALAAFGQIATGEKQPLYAVGLYHQARLKALKGDKAGAVELFKKALEHGATPDLTEEINNRLALLEAT
jgi:tetratricopeptide (TPR) repeat protein